LFLPNWKEKPTTPLTRKNRAPQESTRTLRANKYDRKDIADRNAYVEQEILGTVVSVQPQDANTYLVEVECEALEDVNAFEIVSIGLPFEHIALNSAAGSRLKLACAGGIKVDSGEKVKIAIKPLEGSGVRRRGSENALGPAKP
jgi:hypothetical protein